MLTSRRSPSAGSCRASAPFRDTRNASSHQYRSPSRLTKKPPPEKIEPAVNSASRRAFFGGPDGIRTHDLCVANAALSQLSYRPAARFLLYTISSHFPRGLLCIPALFPGNANQSGGDSVRETDQARAAGDTIMTSANVPVKIFPITVPIMGPEAFAFFQPPPVDRLSDEVWIHDLYPVQYSLTRLDELAELVESPRLPGPEWHRLVQRGEELSLDPGANELIAPRHLAEVWRRAGVIPYPHQLETARRVLFEMGGRAILADEVGLGKTIEAGLIIKECLLRHMARKVLILTPAGLVWQWFRELKEKFNLVFGMQRSEYDWERTDLLIASLDTAKRSPHQEIIHRLHYDILVVDEAHKLKNASTQSYQFVNRIRRKFCLMLTATP